MSGFLVLAVFLLSTSPVPSSSQQAPDFTLCPRGSVFTGPELTSLSGGSAADCAKNCSQTSGCEAFNVCPDHMSGAVTCHLLSDNNPQGCAGLSPSPFPDCRYVYKWFLACENGGISNGTHCACPLPFSGKTCQRYITDCREAYRNGYQSGNGVYLIQPVGSPSPFLARCALGNKGSQYVLVRTTMSFDVTWATATAGIGDPAAGDFFIGLDKLHYLTQTLRSIHFFMWSTTGSKHIINYYDFTVGPESSSYQLSYSSFSTGPDWPAMDGFAAEPPLIFSALDHDVNGCAATRGYSGWFGANCEGYSPFAGQLTWPINSTEVATLSSIHVSV